MSTFQREWPRMLDFILAPLRYVMLIQHPLLQRSQQEMRRSCYPVTAADWCMKQQDRIPMVLILDQDRYAVLMRVLMGVLMEVLMGVHGID